MDEESLQWLFNQAQALSVGALCVEVGSWLGRSTIAMALGLKQPKNLVCVDTWKGSPEMPAECFKMGEPAEILFQRNLLKLAGFVPRMIISDSTENAGQFEDETIDFWFLDANHDYDHVKADILAWLPKMKKGGIMAGHDWFHEPIKRALFEIFGSQNVSGVTSCCWRVDLPV